MPYESCAVKAGVDPDKVTACGNTALDLAAEKGDLDIVSLLLHDGECTWPTKQTDS